MPDNQTLFISGRLPQMDTRQPKPPRGLLAGRGRRTPSAGLCPEGTRGWREVRETVSLGPPGEMCKGVMGAPVGIQRLWVRLSTQLGNCPPAVVAEVPRTV